MKKIFFDTETTGLAPGNIAQLSLIIEEDNKETIAKNYFMKIDYISASAEKCCGRGIDFYEKASGGKKFIDYKDELKELFTGGAFIAHNLPFDENFLSTEFWRAGIQVKPLQKLDTMNYFKNICNILGKTGRVKNPSLSELVDYYKIDKEKILIYTKQLFGTDENISFHDARYDTTALYIVFQLHRDELNNKDNWKKTFCLK